MRRKKSIEKISVQRVLLEKKIEQAILEFIKETDVRLFWVEANPTWVSEAKTSKLRSVHARVKFHKDENLD